MSLVDLLLGRKKQNKRLGRGLGSGRGKTAGRGTKGQKSRSGASRKISPWFEGGQTPSWKKAPKKRGFSHKVLKPAILTTHVINQFFVDGEEVSLKTIREKNIFRINEMKRGVKVINRGELKVNVKFIDVLTSKSLNS